MATYETTIPVDPTQAPIVHAHIAEAILFPDHVLAVLADCILSLLERDAARRWRLRLASLTRRA